MDERTEKPTRKRKKKKRSNIGYILIPFFLIIAGIAAFFAWKYEDISMETLVTKGQEILNIKGDTPSEKDGQFISNIEGSKNNLKSTGDESPTRLQNSEKDNIAKKDKPTKDMLKTGEENQDQSLDSPGKMNTPDKSPQVSLPSDLSKFGEIKMSEEASSVICLKSTEIIKGFYTHLDKQRYMESYGLKKGSEDHFNQLIQKLLNNPPIVSGEMNDLYSILQNTAHFFRVIGKDNILVLKGILDREKDSFEDVLAHFYASIHNPTCLNSNFSLSVNEDPLYDYAGFFLNTMGGRLYLFRRDSMSRMVVSFYAILLIDLANSNGSNKHGIEIRGPIDQLIAEIESTSNTLSLRENYLDTLYSLKEKYQ